jgi:peptide/nickel transport system substrate-binding protein
MRGKARSFLLLIGVGLIALLAAGCGSSSKSSSSGSGTSTSSSATSTTAAAAALSGPGYTSPTAPTGAKIKGGTVTFVEGAQAAPTYIFPMTSAQVCSTANTSQFSEMLYRPLYWFGNNYKPTVDYSYSPGDAPVYSDGDKTVTVHIKPWKWSNGTPVTARDVQFYLNMYKADPGANYCGYVPGFFPDNVVSTSVPNQQTLVLHLNRAYDPEWFTYNELSQLYPLPLSWDRTSLSAPAPTSATAKLPDTTKKGAEAVYKFLNAQATKSSSWASSPIWSVVDGPFKLSSFTSSGQVTMVPNAKYSGSPKPTIAKFVELPFTSDTAVFNEERSGGPSAVTIGSVPAQDEPQVPKLAAEGYTNNKASSYSINYFVINFHNPTVGPVFSQLYARQALAHLIDQQGWTKAFLNNTATPTYGPIPASPSSPLASYSASANPYPFSPTAAAALLKANGWKVVPGGKTTCIQPGTASGDCGAGIKSGEGISFNLDYQSGVATLASEMNDFQAQAKKVGITINLTEHPFADVISTAVACTSKQSTCKWTAQNWGAGWIYAPDYLPTGEELYGKGSVANYGSYYSPEAQKLIDKTVYGPVSDEKTALTGFSKYLETQVPVLYGPTSIGTFQGDGGTLISNKLGGYIPNVYSSMTPENWYLTK